MLTPSPPHVLTPGTDGSFEEIHETGFVEFEVDHFYKLSFTMVGDEMSCALYDAESGSETPLLKEHLDGAFVRNATGTGYISEAGGTEFGCYSNTQYVGRGGHAHTTRPPAARPPTTRPHTTHPQPTHPWHFPE